MNMKRIIVGCLIASLLLLTGCTTPTSEADLDAAVAALGIVSVLPNLTANDRKWIDAASTGLSCSAAVLAKSESAAQEAVDITTCFATLPVVPTNDSIYISTAIGAVEVFIALFAPAPVPAAVSANASVRKWDGARKQAYVAQVRTKLSSMRR